MDQFLRSRLLLRTPRDWEGQVYSHFREGNGDCGDCFAEVSPSSDGSRREVEKPAPASGRVSTSAASCNTVWVTCTRVAHLLRQTSQVQKLLQPCFETVVAHYRRRTDTHARDDNIVLANARAVGEVNRFNSALLLRRDLRRGRTTHNRDNQHSHRRGTIDNRTSNTSRGTHTDDTIHRRTHCARFTQEQHDKQTVSSNLPRLQTERTRNTEDDT